MTLHALLASTAVAALVPFFHVSLTRVLHAPERAVFLMFSVFIFDFILLLTYGFFRLSLDPYVLLTALCAWAFWCLGYMEFFSMICRGFSLTIISDVYLKPGQTFNEILQSYGEGKGADWLFRKRLDGLVRAELLADDGSRLALSGGRSYWIGRFALAFKSVLKLEKGG